jgi:hypothetical protein
MGDDEGWQGCLGCLVFATAAMFLIAAFGFGVGLAGLSVRWAWRVLIGVG